MVHVGCTVVLAVGVSPSKSFSLSEYGGGDVGDVGDSGGASMSGSGTSSHHTASGSDNSSSFHAAVVDGGGVKGCLVSLSTVMRNVCSGSVLNCHLGINGGGTSLPSGATTRRRLPMNAGAGDFCCCRFSTREMKPVPILASRF